ncbi:MAG: MBL fold metallo-hydrolase, partial [Eubacterium sp.]|nr:MBL fold metallo-hydrolase [Eubacterium sp.]
ADFDKGEYQWVAKVTNQIVFADPKNTKARMLCADALEQLGYQSESGTWRNAYLTGAAELRLGNLAKDARTAGGGDDVRKEMTGKMMLDYVAISTDAEKAAADDLTFNLTCTDSGEKFFVKRIAGTYLVYKGETDPSADASLTTTRANFMKAFMFGQADAMKEVTVTGDANVPERILKYVVAFKPDFNVVEP